MKKVLFKNKKYHFHVLEKCLYVPQEVRSIIYFWQFIHPLSLCSRGIATHFAFTSYIIISTKFCIVTFLNIFCFVSFFYHLLICQRHRKIILVTLSKTYLNKCFFLSFFLVYLASLSYLSLLLNSHKQIKQREKSTLHCI